MSVKMKQTTVIIILLIYETGCVSSASSDAQYEAEPASNEKLKQLCVDVALGLGSHTVAIVWDDKYDNFLVRNIQDSMMRHGLSTLSYPIIYNNNAYLEHLSSYLNKERKLFSRITTIVLGHQRLADNLTSAILHGKWMLDRLVYVFVETEMSKTFLNNIVEAMKVVILKKSQEVPDSYDVWFSQSSPFWEEKSFKFEIVNHWNRRKRFSQNPMLPSARTVYSNFQRRVFHLPVIHKPPWYYATFPGDGSVNATGGRDHRVLEFLADALNFTFVLVDPPKHSRGSSFNSDGTFPGILGQLYDYDPSIDWFLDDTTQTLYRNRVVEFSFPVLDDAGGYVTHAPGLVSRVFILVKPFTLNTWISLISTVVVAVFLYGLMLWAIDKFTPFHTTHGFLGESFIFIYGNVVRQPVGLVPGQASGQLFAAVWLIFSLIVSCSWQAKIVSQYINPQMETPINTLDELLSAMQSNGYSLNLKPGSSTEALFKTGEGIYSDIWQERMRVGTEPLKDLGKGITETTANKLYTVAAGRKLLLFYQFQLGKEALHVNNEVFFVKYKGICFKFGSPYIPVFNDVILRMWSAGLLNAIGDREFYRIKLASGALQSSAPPTPKEKGISLNALQGGFWVWLMGLFASSVVCVVERIKISRCWDSRHGDQKSLTEDKSK